MEASSLIASRERVGLLDRVASLERNNARLRGTQRMAGARVDRLRRCMSFMEGELRQIHRFHYYNIMRFRRLETFTNGDDDDNKNVGGNGNENSSGNGDENGRGNGNRNGGGNKNGNPNQNDRGTEGVVGLTRWFEKMKIVFYISNCPERYQVKYTTCTLLNSALTWWNIHKRTIRDDAAFAMSWRELMKLMNERFQELTILCTKMVLEEEDRVEKFIRGLSDNIKGNVIAAEPTRLQDVVWIANNLLDQKLKGYAVRNAEKKRSNYKKVGHMVRDCKAVVSKTTRGAQEPNQKGNKTNKARGKAYVLGGGEENPDSNVVTGTFLLNNHYASMLFDSGADRSFLSTTFSALLDVIPSTLDVSYARMSATRQGMSSAEIDHIMAQRVTDAIEAIAIYETKIRKTHDPRNQVIRQETTIEKNANNKRKFENQPKDILVP
ncbi:hypothetical protein Tco_0993877 [Tanacetum coccineum]